MSEYDRSIVLLNMLTQLNAGTGTADQLGKFGFADLDRLAAQIPTVQHQEIECIEEDRPLIVAVAQHLEHGHAALVAAHGLAIDYE
jgi:hypothetical protein